MAKLSEQAERYQGKMSIYSINFTILDRHGGAYEKGRFPQS